MKNGFTLVEIIVSIAILALIASLGLFISMDFFKDYSFRSEQNVIVSLLQNARSQSLNNIDQVRHGIHFQGSPWKYIVFECPAATPQCNSYATSTSDLITTPRSNVSLVNLPPDIIFNQLDGSLVSSSSSITIILFDGVKNSTTTINSEGRID